jgi:glutamyl/glutaminyl-tRNA synthetase
MPEKVVTRFAPSPTGYLHVGGARTALFSWLFAQKMGGKFILRIEDTDLKRNTPTAMQQVIDDLRWLGIEWDEGPQVDGPNGPYLQSQRLDIYNEYLSKLIEQNKAYYCFDTTEELQAMRAKAEAEKKGFIYPRPEVFPSTTDAKKARADGMPVTVRLLIPRDEQIVVSDIIRGQVTFAAGEFGDFVIQKSDGFPTYHFSCVVDDELMGVTHVIRGQEHLMNTPGHQVLQKALGFRTPVYVHMSVTVSQGGGKLSKRERPKTLRQAIKATGDIDLEKLAGAGDIDTEQLQSYLTGKSTPDMPSIDAMAKYLGIDLPEINVVDFFRSGYLPEALVNFIALLGFSPGGDREIMPFAELIECFDLSRLTKANSFFDRAKLLAFNTEHIRMVPKDKLLDHFKAYLEVIDSPLRQADDQKLTKILELSQGSRTLAQIEGKSRFLFIENEHIEYDQKAVKKVLMKNEGLAVLKIVRDQLASMEQLTEQNIETMLRSLAEQREVGLGKVAQPLRVALCGSTVSLPIFDSVQMLGRQNTLTRIDNTLTRFKTDT